MPLYKLQPPQPRPYRLSVTQKPLKYFHKTRLKKLSENKYHNPNHIFMQSCPFVNFSACRGSNSMFDGKPSFYINIPHPCPLPAHKVFASYTPLQSISTIIVSAMVKVVLKFSMNCVSAIFFSRLLRMQ